MDPSASQPFVSIVIANWNYEQFVGQAIDSALAQTYPHREIIVVDDGSTDRSREIIQSYGDRILPVFKENAGHTSAINAGFTASRGDLISWLDSDDVFLPTKVEEVVRAYREHPEAVLIYHQLQTVDVDRTPRQRPWPRDVWTGAIKDKVIRSGGWWPRPTTSALSLRRTYLERLHPLRESSVAGEATWPDTYTAMLAPFFGEIVGIPRALTLYRMHGQNNSHAKIKRQMHVRQLEFEYEELKRALASHNMHEAIRDIQRNVLYMQYAYGERASVTLPRLCWAILACPLLRWPSKLREVGKLAGRHV